MSGLGRLFGLFGKRSKESMGIWLCSSPKVPTHQGVQQGDGWRRGLSPGAQPTGILNWEI